ncbi:CBL-interacting protein kinase 32-like isoform X2 [Zingiber officinale]|uniref:CBL-interacting protein kinase 32-like isoform X2 n=1 Tax=Zingiber officinale TaxID=94328 RepID=UPI001C4B83E6|nr:CBL-interacting protein kinase 32-like isoform X2 [Zingiber officinale]
MNTTKVKRRVSKYELGRTIGEGTFAKVKFARNIETKEPVAIKILDKEKVLKHKLVEQIKREVATMKLIKHPNVVRIYEVMGSKSKIFIVLEFATGGELFDKIVNHGRMREDKARRYFQQLINAVDYCHSRGVYHRDLKPENLLLDACGNLKVSDFGLSALSQQVRDDGLLHTTCGTPNYVAPEVLNDRGYDGATADLWSCGVILFVLLAGYLPFEDSNIKTLYKKISSAEFKCPSWLSFGAMRLLARILHPNPSTRVTIPEILEDEWFKKDYEPPVFEENYAANSDDVGAVFKDSEEHHVTEKKEEQPTPMNAFELISMSKGLDLGNLFSQEQEFKRETRFTSTCSAKEIITKIEEVAKPLGFDIQKKNYKVRLIKRKMMRLENVKAGRKGNLKVATEVFQVAPSLHMVELRKAKGDTLEFHKFYKNLSSSLKDVVWISEDRQEQAK